MKYAVLADLHLGTGIAREESLAVMRELSEDGYTLILAGDIFDTWRNPRAFEQYKSILKPGDIYITGNHDAFTPATQGVQKTTALTLYSGGKRFFITHGDVVDFVYAAHVLEQAAHGNELVPWWARVAGALRSWRATDILGFYRAMDAAPAWAVRSLEHGAPKFIQRLQAFAVLLVLTIANFRRSDIAPWAGRPTVNGSSIVDKSPAERLRRVEGFFPSARDADAVIIGHFHEPEYELVGSRPFITLGAWVQKCDPTVVLIENGEVKVRHYIGESYV